jgi:hypothetical protein
MTVYVDNYRVRKRVGRLDAVWSHMLADSESELLAFAERIGLRRDWIQYPGTIKVHFDVTDNVRARAIRAGAQAIGWRELGEMIARRRDAERARRAFEAPTEPEPEVEQLTLDDASPADPAAAFVHVADRLAAGVIPEGVIACGPPPPRRRRSPAGGVERARNYSERTRNHWWTDGELPHWHHCRWCGLSYENRPVARSGAWFREWHWPEQRPAGAVDGDTLADGKFPRCPGPPERWTPNAQ